MAPWPWFLLLLCRFSFCMSRAFEPAMFLARQITLHSLPTNGKARNLIPSLRCQNAVVRSLPAAIAQKLETDFHKQTHHPVGMLRRHLAKFFSSYSTPYHSEIGGFRMNGSLSPIVSLDQNFDRLLIPSDHVSRSPSDTFYLNDTHVLRTHTTAHTPLRLANGEDRFMTVGPVFRQDEIDSTHYPVFTQMDICCLLPEVTAKQADAVFLSMLNELMNYLGFSKEQYRILGDTFPFTSPSWQIEVRVNILVGK
eukprot:GHVN01003662.1.p1 GENE.GHVN01003662.1~~GHVN01003662.1.p1  ORF type:complete len:252 (+),score=5.50 GHVN01003662.1:68-823(+)